MSDNIFKLPVATQCRREAARMDNQNDDQAWAIFIRAADHIVALEARVKELEAENAELREAVARCRYQASFIIGSPESLREIMRKIREIANETLADDEGEA